MKKIPCTKCAGSGTVELPPHLRAMLGRFRNPAARLTTSDFMAESDVTQTAYNNRLEELRALGLLERERNGRLWEYRRTTSKPK